MLTLQKSNTDVFSKIVEYYLHEKLLALWGCPIGELWDLEKLADKCAERKQWTFFLASTPNHVKGIQV